jgi:hypothetical protein
MHKTQSSLVPLTVRTSSAQNHLQQLGAGRQQRIETGDGGFAPAVNAHLRKLATAPAQRIETGDGGFAPAISRHLRK